VEKYEGHHDHFEEYLRAKKTFQGSILGKSVSKVARDHIKIYEMHSKSMTIKYKKKKKFKVFLIW